MSNTVTVSAAGYPSWRQLSTLVASLLNAQLLLARISSLTRSEHGDRGFTSAITLNGIKRMNWAIATSNWTQFQGTVRARWSKLNSEHLDAIAGQRSVLLAKLQDLYAITKVVADKEIKVFEQRNKDYRGK